MANTYTISGIIYDEHNAPLSAGIVELFEKDLRSEKSLGLQKTDLNGAYSIAFNDEAATPEFKGPDVFIRISEGRNKILGESPIYYNIEENTQIDFKIGGGIVLTINEYDALIKLLKPIVEASKLRFDQLEETEINKDFSFLTGETGEEYEKIEAIALAHEMSVKVKVDASFYYALLRLGQPKELIQLILVANDTLKSTIENAVEKNIISSQALKSIDKWILEFKTNALEKAISDDKSPVTNSVKEITKTLLKSEEQNTLLKMVYDSEIDQEKFWETLKTKPGFNDDKKIHNLKSTFELNALIGDQPALTDKLLAHLKTASDYKSIRTLAGLDKDEWKDHIKNAGIKNFPEEISGKNDGEKIENYAMTLEANFKATFPTSWFAGSLKKDTNSAFDNKKDLDTFFATNPNFELTSRNFMKDFKTAKLEGISDSTMLEKNIKTIHRIQKLSDNNYNLTNALVKEKLTSASAIANKYGISSFVKAFASVAGNEAKAKETIGKVLSMDKRTTALLVNHKMNNDIPTTVTHSIAKTEDSTSSETKYDYHEMFNDGELCDCDHCQSVYSPAAYFVDMLANLKGENKKAFCELMRRRPDLEHIHLTCKNTNTAMPYIDLVNELMEKYVLYIKDGSNNIGIISSSYQTENTTEILDAIPEYINSDGNGETLHTDAYIPLRDIATGDFAFSNKLPFDEPFEQTKVYLNKLGWTRYEFLRQFSPIQSNQYTEVNFAKSWFGVPESFWKVVSGETPLTISFNLAQHNLEGLLPYMRVSYQQLQDLLQCQFLNPGDVSTRAIKIEQYAIADNKITCNLDKLYLTSITSEWLNKTARFIRLWKLTGWELFEVDKVLIGFGLNEFPTQASFSKKLLLPLYQIAILKEKIKINITQVLTLSGDLRREEYFDLSKEYHPQITSLYQSLFKNDPLKKFDFSLTINENKESIAAAFNTDINEIGTFVQLENEVSSLTKLSLIYRHVLLSKFLNVSVTELRKMLALTASDLPIDANWEFEKVLHFIDRISIVKEIGLKSDVLVKSITVDKELLSIVIEYIKKFDLLASSPVVENIESLRKTILEKLISEINNSRFFKSPLATEETNSVKIAFDGILNGDLEKLSELDTEKLTAKLKAISPLLIGDVPLFDILKFSNEDIVWIKENAEGLNIKKLWTENQVDTTYTYNCIEQLFFLSRLIKRKKVSNSNIIWADFANEVFKQNGTKESFIKNGSELYNIQVEIFNQLIGTIDPVNPDQGILQMHFPNDFTKIRNLEWILDKASILEKLTPSPDQVISISKLNPEQEDALDVLNLLKSKYPQKEWLKTIGPLNDTLREKRRDALIDWLLVNDQTTWTIPTDIYKYLLIDTEMDACMDTSRIKQAISSVQLFIDRCLMGLEAEVTLDDDFATQWNTWRKQYRVWEANRKIFLYPENWLEPELRDDRSPFFKELESQLTQNEVTEETAKEALLTYLQKLDNVAKLDIVGLFNDDDTGKLHVIGRTYNFPHQYFYRYQYKNVWSAWEKIEIDIEGDHILPVVWNGRLMLFWAQFTEKQVSPKSGSTKIKKPDRDGDMAMVNEEPAKFLEMKLVWSEYRNGKWSGKKVSKAVLTIGNDKEKYNIDKKDKPPLISKLLITSFVYKFSTLHLVIYQESFSVIKELYLCGSFKFTNSNEEVEFEEMFKYIPSNQDGTLDPLSYDQNSQLHQIKIKALNKINDNHLLISRPPDIIPIDTVSFFKIIDQEFTLEFTVKNLGSSKLIPLKHNLLDKKKLLYFQTNKDHQFLVKYNSFSYPFLSNNSTSNSIYSNKMDRNLLKHTFNSNIRFLHYYSFYHPKISDIINRAYLNSFDSLYSISLQNNTSNFFQNEYIPSNLVKKPYPVNNIDYSNNGSYSLYNWELFVHIPLTIASQLMQNQKYEEARKWLHFIFNPTVAGNAEEGPSRFWITKPFREEITNMVTLENLLESDGYAEELNTQLENWEENPFSPHAVARFRISAYMRKTFLMYIDILIKWGDQLFARDTIETINEATLLYLLAQEILGKRQQAIPKRAEPPIRTFFDIKDGLNSFSNIVVKEGIELLIDAGNTTDNNLKMYYFGLPKNEYIVKYWDTIEDRLYKIRNCMNMEGVVRSLALFEPPLDPGMLIRMRAAGLSINDVLDNSVSIPHYRFQVMLQKANELCNDVKNLGSSLLSAIEKKDSEQLSLLRNTHELSMLALIKRQKKWQRDETRENLASLNESKKNIENRYEYYSSRNFMNTAEALSFESIYLGMTFQIGQAQQELLAAILYNTPDFKIGSGFTLGATAGGTSTGNSAKASATVLQAMGIVNTTAGTMSNIVGGYQRRMDDWKFQTKSAEIELKQIEKQITAAEIRLAIAEQDLVNHDRQAEQSREVDDFMRSKFSNAELYKWMVEQLSTVYFQTYNLAYSSAKKAEKCMQYELGLDDINYIKFGYWDNLKSGLLSGEKLQLDLRLLENTYLEKNKRDYEIVKHVSVSMLDPLALIKLRATGSCEFNIPEALYDMDFPGQYFRRIKSVSLSIPCIAGPYTSVSSKLSLTKSSYRKSNVAANYPQTNANDVRFNFFNTVEQSIASSHGQNDSGVFELNFRDERYLPFEGTGAISSWKLELPTEVRQFDYNTISDVVLHLKYTASDGGSLLKDASNGEIRNQLNIIVQDLSESGLHIAINMKHDMPNEWHMLKQKGTVDLLIDKSRLPYMAQAIGASAAISEVIFIAKVMGNPVTFSFDVNSTSTNLSTIQGMDLLQGTNNSVVISTPFNLAVALGDVNNLEELMMLVKYTF